MLDLERTQFIIHLPKCFYGQRRRPIVVWLNSGFPKLPKLLLGSSISWTDTSMAVLFHTFGRGPLFPSCFEIDEMTYFPTSRLQGLLDTV
jgi:hypothetical protein